MMKLFPFLIVFYEITTYLSNDMYLPALPQMTQDLGLTQALGQLTMTMWFLGATSIQLFLGPISDRCGRRPVLLWGGVLFVVSTIVCAYTADVTTMLIARFLQGCTVCSVVVAGYATIHESYEHKEAIRILALLSSITVLAPALGPLVGGFLLVMSGWRAIFWMLALWAVVGLLMLYKWMPESNPVQKRKPLLMRVIFSDYYAILKNGGFVFNGLAFCAIFGGIIGWIAMGPFLSINTFGYSPLMFCVFQMIIFGCFMLGSRFVKYGLDWWGVSKLISVGLGIALFGAFFALVLSIVLPAQFVLFVCAFSIFALGAAITFGPLHRTTIEASSVPMGARMAVFSTTMSLFGVIGSVLASIYTDTSFALGCIVMTATLFACLIRWLACAKKQMLLSKLTSSPTG